MLEGFVADVACEVLHGCSERLGDLSASQPWTVLLWCFLSLLSRATDGYLSLSLHGCEGCAAWHVWNIILLLARGVLLVQYRHDRNWRAVARVARWQALRPVATDFEDVLAPIVRGGCQLLLQPVDLIFAPDGIEHRLRHNRLWTPFGESGHDSRCLFVAVDRASVGVVVFLDRGVGVESSLWRGF